ncbi:cytochrome P450 family protein [Zophobihabitans entericus]|uniref:Cytochrome P450 n=1 Tax=Zophobihabitans entericus TaxID=1635327 RepID=A0A6G9IC49_9GAMM|nr:hypothetical protein [Zophobihabitans entericus]QIQ21399.1 hypothetical protein IPMB12_06670 [Zophobihabitans entericus]
MTNKEYHMVNKCPIHINSHDDVIKALTDEQFYVRPVNQKVPKILEGSLAGNVFASLVRMRDDQLQTKIKLAIINSIDQYDVSLLSQQTFTVAKILTLNLKNTQQLNQFIADVPICVIAGLFQISERHWPELVNYVRSFIDDVILNPQEERVQQADLATKYLFHIIKKSEGGLLQNLRLGFKQQGIEDDFLVLSNCIGLFFQTADGTSGLLGQMLIHYSDLKSAPEDILTEVLSQNPPIKFTKRFPNKETKLTGHAITEEDTLLLDLKTEQGSVPFGLGEHQCPGSEWAKAISLAAFNYLRSLPLNSSLFTDYRWKELGNAAIPIFYDKE